jgi:hypothetical protein
MCKGSCNRARKGGVCSHRPGPAGVCSMGSCWVCEQHNVLSAARVLTSHLALESLPVLTYGLPLLPKRLPPLLLPLHGPGAGTLRRCCCCPPVATGGGQHGCCLLCWTPTTPTTTTTCSWWRKLLLHAHSSWAACPGPAPTIHLLWLEHARWAGAHHHAPWATRAALESTWETWPCSNCHGGVAARHGHGRSTPIRSPWLPGAIWLHAAW